MQITPESLSANAVDGSASDRPSAYSSPDIDSAPIEVKVPAVLFDLIPKYLDNRRNELKVLSEAVKAQDFSTIKSVGHKLKGNAGSYGFTYLTEIGAVFESAAAKMDLDQIRSTLTLYQTYLVRIKPVPEP